MVQLARAFDVAPDTSDASFQYLENFHVESSIHSLPLWYELKMDDTADIKTKQ